MENSKLVETFSEFKEFKNIDREAMMRIIEDVFRNVLNKKFNMENEGTGQDSRQVGEFRCREG